MRIAGDAASPWWTYEDLDAVFGRRDTRRLMAAWEVKGFPAPLPWSRREKRWRPAAVLAWMNRQEIQARATLPSIAA